MSSLAADTDVRNVLQRDLTTDEAAACETLLNAASDRFRSEARQQFTTGESTVRLKLNGRRTRLEQVPAIDVSSVTDDNGDPVDYTWSAAIPQWLVIDRDSSTFVTVTYSHGADEVPDRVRVAVAEMVARALIVPEEVMAGARQIDEQAGPVQISTGWFASAPTGGLQLSDEDRALARSFWWKGGQVVVQTP